MSSLARECGVYVHRPFAALNAAVILFGAAGVCGFGRENF